MKADFSGYATKAGLKCSDGRTIMPEAFKNMDGMTVPLVWQHAHNEPSNVLGHAVLECREDGVYAYGFFNDTDAAKNAKTLVEHKDITSLSIYANQLVERAKQVFHGVIREVSLVLSGANPGARIDNVAIAHADGSQDVLDDEAVIFTGLELEHEDKPVHNNENNNSNENNNDGEIEHATAQEVYDSLSQEQKDVVHYMIAAALEAQSGNGTQHSGDQNKEGDLTHKEGNEPMSRNVFEKNGKVADGEKHVLSHEDVKGIVADAVKCGSLKEAVEDYALKHGIENIDILFPDAKNVNDAAPDFIKRRTEWVAGVLNGTKHSPFSRIKTRTADLTFEEARAKGYIKGSLKKEEFFGVSQRTTGPTTIYKKQKLDRDDMLDITDFDVVAWLKGEMRLMLEEEIARAVLIGDGRAADDEDKIKDPVGATDGIGIRSILNDDELYVTTVETNVAVNGDYNDVVEAVMRSMRFYKGTGSPTFYTTNQVLVEMLLSKDNYGRRRWNNKQELAAALMVSDIVEVEVMDTVDDLIGILVNLTDYNIGADRGGDISMFDDFDIDYNQYKYLIETRVSGALTKVKSAMVVRRVASTDVEIEPTAPTFDGTTITIPTDANVDYAVNGTPVVDGSTHAVAAGDTAVVTATPTAGHYFENNAEDQWSFSNNA
jgi:HK97 family phage prohead protease